MMNCEIAAIFEKLAFFLSLKNENDFKIRAYLRAAKSIQKYPIPLEEVLAAGEALTKIDSVGKIIAKKIEELIIFNELKALTEIYREYPESLHELNRIKGIGPKTIHKLYHSYHIQSLRQLRDAFVNNDPLDIPHTYKKRIRDYFQC